MSILCLTPVSLGALYVRGHPGFSFVCPWRVLRAHILLLLLYGATHCDSARAVSPDRTVLVVRMTVGEGGVFVLPRPRDTIYTGYTIIIIHKYAHTCIIYIICGMRCGAIVSGRLSAFRPLHRLARSCLWDFLLAGVKHAQPDDEDRNILRLHIYARILFEPVIYL